MADRSNFGAGLRRARRAKRMTQEDFGDPSSRTYVSMLERNVRSPTLAKIVELSNTLGIHPLSLLALAFVKSSSPNEMEKLLAEVQTETEAILRAAQDQKPIR